MGYCKYCGEFFDPRILGGHTTFCTKNPNYKKNIERSSKQFHDYLQKKRSLSNYGECKYCGSKLDKLGKKFCNSSCAAKYNNAKRKESGRETTKGKTKIVNCIKCGNIVEVSIHSAKDTWLCEACGGGNYNKKIYRTPLRKYGCVCKVCGKQFLSRRKTSCHCSHQCSANDPEVKEKLRQKQLELIEEGKHQGWQTRNIRSYPEEFWKKVLDNNNISYAQEVYITQYHYFLDFLIEIGDIKIDLEIDGGQHLRKEVHDKDVIRDERLKTMGYTIYRVPWNEINSEDGKSKMKIKIDKFLDFYKSIGE